MQQLKIALPQQPKVTGLKDYGHVYLNCSNCLAPLADIWIVDKDFPVDWKFKAECPHCNDASFVKEVRGKFYLGPGCINKDKTDIEGEKDMIYTYIDYFEEIDDHILIKTKKGREWSD